MEDFFMGRERDSNIVEDIKAFLSELTSNRETKLIEDPKQQGKKVQALSVSLKQPSEDDLKCSMSLKQNTEKDREESEPIRVQDKHISTASLQQRGERIALWCIQRIQVHFECMAVQMKRIQNSLSRFHTISLDKETTSIPIFLDCSNLIEEWSQVEELVRHCRRLNDSLVSRRAQSRYRTNYEKEERLRFLVKEL